MRSTPCPRLFEVEAARDGRLTGAERASFERHAIGCAACSREVQALEALAEALRTSTGDEALADELHARRERTRLLAAFDDALLAPAGRWSVRRRVLWPAAVATLVAGIFILQRVRRPAGEIARTSCAIVHADSTAVWSERMDGTREEIVLARGGLWIHVDHSSGQGHLIVLLPDGELEDIGTTFTVSAEDGHTTRVAVEAGHVVFRIRGLPTIAVGPGDTWTPEPRSAVSALASATPPADTALTEPLDAGKRTTPPPPPTSPPASNPSVDFRAAMAALDVGDNHQAAAAFANFLENHPHDARAEDAAYLRMIALQRSLDSAGMKQAALEYLRRYPAGFRHAEALALSR